MGGSQILYLYYAHKIFHISVYDTGIKIRPTKPQGVTAVFLLRIL